MNKTEGLRDPWRAEYDQDTLLHRIYDTDGYLVAEVGSLSVTYDQQVANAHLIAAAPELFEALKEALVNLECTFRDAGKRRDAAAKRAREILARASGGA